MALAENKRKRKLRWDFFITPATFVEFRFNHAREFIIFSLSGYSGFEKDRGLTVTGKQNRNHKPKRF